MPGFYTADLAGEYLRGVQASGHIAAENRRLSLESERMQMEAQMRADSMKRESDLQQQRLAVQSARTQAETQLRKQLLENVAQMNAFRTRQAALKLADQYGFAKDLAGGMSTEQALLRHPTLSTPSAVVQAHKMDSDLAAQRLALHQKEVDLRERAIADREKKPESQGHVSYDGSKLSFTAVPTGSKLGQALTRSYGTELPADVLTNAVPGFTPPAPTNAPAEAGLMSRAWNWMSRNALAPGAGSAPITNAPIASGEKAGGGQPSSEVVKWTKDGKQAVFDASTKKFLRWADAAPDVKQLEGDNADDNR